MSLDKLLMRSAILEEQLAEYFGIPLANTSGRLLACQALASLSFEHSQSMKHLIAAGLFTSAAALLRVQYESLVRALWVLYVASDSDAELMVAELTRETAKRASKIPMLSIMLDEIEEKAPHAPISHLREFKHYSWRPLSSFVHGGIHAVNRHGKGFPAELVIILVRHSNGLLGMAGNLLLILGGIPPEAGTMASIYRDYADCFPPAISTHHKTGALMLTMKRSDPPTENDLLPAILELLVEDMNPHPDRMKLIEKELLKRSMELVEGVEVDLDAPPLAE